MHLCLVEILTASSAVQIVSVNNDPMQKNPDSIEHEIDFSTHFALSTSVFAFAGSGPPSNTM